MPKKHKVKTTGLAGGLHCPYKGLLPACARKAHGRSANCTTFTAALKRASSVLPHFGTAPKGAYWFALTSYDHSKWFIFCFSSPAHP